MTLEEFSIIAKCNGTFTEAFRPDIDEKKTEEDMISKIDDLNISEGSNELYENKFNIIIHDENNLDCKNSLEIRIKKANIDFFRVCIFASTKRDNFFLVANTNRKTFGQTGEGHFTPIAAYNNKSDFVLLLDTARFKYNSMWFKTSLVFESLKPLDKTTNKIRGFILCSKYY